jgi:hypothetical protein
MGLRSIVPVLHFKVDRFARRGRSETIGQPIHAAISLRCLEDGRRSVGMVGFRMTEVAPPWLAIRNGSDRRPKQMGFTLKQQAATGPIPTRALAVGVRFAARSPAGPASRLNNLTQRRPSPLAHRPPAAPSPNAPAGAVRARADGTPPPRRLQSAHVEAPPAHRCPSQRGSVCESGSR